MALDGVALCFAIGRQPTHVTSAVVITSQRQLLRIHVRVHASWSLAIRFILSTLLGPEKNSIYDVAFMHDARHPKCIFYMDRIHLGGQ